jgi:hypothetical protein
MQKYVWFNFIGSQIDDSNLYMKDQMHSLLLEFSFFLLNVEKVYCILIGKSGILSDTLVEAVNDSSLDITAKKNSLQCPRLTITYCYKL